MSATRVADIRLNGEDPAGARIAEVYARNPPHYAVYRTSERVLAWFADDPAEAGAQRARLARLNPARGAINGLVDGWRTGPAHEQARARRYERGVADALVMALEGPGDAEAADAAALLDQIKADVLAERTSRACLQYVLAALAATLWAILLLILLGPVMRWLAPLAGGACAGGETAGAVRLGAGAGAAGALFSIGLFVQNRTVLPDLAWRDNSLDAALRVLIGTIAGGVLICLLGTGLVSLTLAGRTLDFTGLEAAKLIGGWMTVAVAGFAAGFSEQLVPDLLAKAQMAAETPTKPAAAPPAAAAPAAKSPPPPPGGGSGGPPAPAAALADGQGEDCLCGHPVSEAEATADADLPAARGGVAEPGA
jgi:hypothetical protein